MILYNTNMIALARIAKKTRRFTISAIRIGFQVIAAAIVFVAMCVSVISKILEDFENE